MQLADGAAATEEGAPGGAPAAAGGGDGSTRRDSSFGLNFGPGSAPAAGGEVETSHARRRRLVKGASASDLLMDSMNDERKMLELARQYQRDLCKGDVHKSHRAVILGIDRKFHTSLQK